MPGVHDSSFHAGVRKKHLSLDVGDVGVFQQNPQNMHNIPLKNTYLYTSKYIQYVCAYLSYIYIQYICSCECWM